MQDKEKLNVQYEHSEKLTNFLQNLNISILLSTYQTSRIACIVSNKDLSVSFSIYDKPMGIAKTDRGLAIGTNSMIWSLMARKNNPTKPNDPNDPDIIFHARDSISTGPIMGHELFYRGGKLWVVNTRFNSICTIEPPWSFKPYWKPNFIPEDNEGDRCHLNGMAFREKESDPSLASALGTGSEINSWRASKANSGAIIDIQTGALIAENLSMPHSPRYYKNEIYFLNSGEGSLERIDQQTCKREKIATMPGFTRGLDFYGGFAFVGLSQIRETNIFGGLPISEKKLEAGVSIIDLKTRKEILRFWFKSVVEEIFSVCVLPGWKNPKLISSIDDQESPSWVLPG